MVRAVRFFRSASAEVGGAAPCVDVDSMDCDHSPDDGIRQSDSKSGELNRQGEADDYKPATAFSGSQRKASSPGEPVPEVDLLNCDLPESPSTSELADTSTGADERMREASSSTTASDVAEDSDGPASDDSLGSCEVDHKDKTVLCFPDYVALGDEYHTASLVAFSSSGIKIQCSSESQGICAYHWGIDDVIDIESQWYGWVETAVVKLRVISRSVVEDENVQGTSGIEELKFAIVDSNWSAKQGEIISLDVRYKARWNVAIDGRVDNDVPGESGFFQIHYFPSFDEPFEEVVYPKGDSDAVSISKRDVDLLQPDTFINDTIIDFYIKYLKNKIPPEEKHRFHFFNSFFFRKLADLDKDPSSASDGRAAFLRVRKWTRKVNLFEKDYIFVPVNFSLHWSLIVICHVGEVTNFEDEDIRKSFKVPCILHMDSIKGSHAGLKDIIQSYLWEEWKERQKETSEDLSLKFLNLRFVSLELPQQENSFDCGLFLLHYAERFLEDAPINFNPFKLTKLSNFLNANWFPPSEVSLKRAFMQRLIYELLDSHSAETSADCSNEQQSEFPENNENETCVEVVRDRFSPAKTSHCKISSSQHEQGIQMTLLTTSSRGSQHVGDSGLVLKDLFEPGATAGSFLDGQYHQSFSQTTSFHSGAMASITEEGEHSQHFVYSPSGETGYEKFDGITSGACALTHSCGEFTAGNSWNPGISMDLADQNHENIASSPGTSSCASLDEPRSPSPEIVVCSTEHVTSGSSELEVVAPDSQDPDTLPAPNQNEDSCSACPENVLSSSPLDRVSMGENEETECNEAQLTDHDDRAFDSDEQQVAKRLRLTPSVEGEGRPARSLSNSTICNSKVYLRTAARGRTNQM